MRHHLDGPTPRRWSQLLGGGALLLALIAVSTAGCAGDQDVAATPQGSTTGNLTPPPSARPPAVRVAPMERAVPVRVRIPAIDANSDLMGLGLESDGTLEVPPNAFPAGWYTGAPTPGERGPAIIAGHVQWDGQPGVFSRLSDLIPENKIVVVRADGSEAVFRVWRVKEFPKAAFPTERIYGNVNHPSLRLITCSDFNDQTDSYDSNTVVFAHLVTPAAETTRS